jgi:hypothetical protein
MEWRIERASNVQAVVFAAEELSLYIKIMDPNSHVAILESSVQIKDSETLKLQIGNYNDLLPKVEDNRLDDAYVIDVSNGKGVIAGTNGRSVLMGVYRFLRELGCKWPVAGKSGEIIPKRKDLERTTISICDKPSYRHRGVCIEGSCSYEHVMNMIDWMPKVGLNAYYNQFATPFAFFDHWYMHKNNKYTKPLPTGLDEVAAMVTVLTQQIKKRGMLYHATGHGWTCDPLGIVGNNWDKAEYDLDDDTKELLAMVDGKRDVWEGIALNTNLCYSNPIAQEKIISAIVDYCIIHPEVDYLHFWLADGWNNHCECDNCIIKRPSDFYVKILNDIDAALTKKQLPTKIVFLIYVYF